MLPLPLQSFFDYLPPEKNDKIPEIGKRVLVPLGKNKSYTGIITNIYHWTDESAKLHRLSFKDLRRSIEILDDYPTVSKDLIALYNWIASYYMCSPGEVMKASLPAGLKLENEPYVEVLPGNDFTTAHLSEKEEIIIESLLARGSLPLIEIEKLLDQKNVRNLIDKMIHKGYVTINLKVSGSYTEKKEKYVRLTSQYQNKDNFIKLLSLLSNSPKQETILLALHQSNLKNEGIREKELLEKSSASISTLNTLRNKGVIEFEYVPIDRLASYSFTEKKKISSLNSEQAQALNQIQTEFLETKPKPILLHGVTGSGKTHVYIEFIREALNNGKQALYLLPEIGLTKQIIDKVKSDLGDVVGVYHSKFSTNERTEIWLKILKKEYRVIIGVRSAILLPFDELGLIIVDEEHDGSFKQSEPSPRYHARDVAVYYSHKFKIPLILGSATPSIESYQNALLGKYKLVEITKRAIQAELPVIEFINMTVQVANHLSYGLLSESLIDAIREAVGKKEQVILFNHRRAYSYFVQCENCGYVPKCLYCDVSLSYHKNEHTIKCHYCGYLEVLTEQCHVCKHMTLKREGVGTERLEEHLSEIFPDFRIARMDLDAMRGKNALQELINQFENGEIDILVGTQMVTKGLDFANATLAAVVQADKLLNFPDFRANEITFQLLTQFSGRPGRGEKKGKVLIQTYNPDHFVLKLLTENYRKFFDAEILARNMPSYPPFSRLIRIELQSKEQVFLEQQGKIFGSLMIKKFKGFMLGPEYPIINRIRNHYRLQIMIKIKPDVSIEWVKKSIRECIDSYYQQATNKTLRFIIDVDPR